MAVEPGFTTGMRELEELIGGIRGPYMLLIVGHPGAGKSTLASQICYVNALKGHKCLYMSFYESKEKLFRNVAKLGINLVEAENKGLLVHVKLPVAATQEVLDTISRLVTKDSYRVVVVDSINPLMDFLKRKEQRAILLNFFYNLVDAINGLLVVVSEVPLGKEALSLGSIEFVADAIVYLKHRVSRGLVTRILEIRKVRGAPLTVVEVPFSIINVKGLRVYLPPRPERPLATLAERLKSREAISSILGPIYAGDIISISHPPSARDKRTNAPFVDIAVENDLKALVISYKYSRTELREIAFSLLTKYFELGEREANWVIDSYMHFESVNPASFSTPELAALEHELIETLNPGIVVFHGCEVPWKMIRDLGEGEYWSQLINQLTWLKNKGVLVVRHIGRVDPHFTRMNESLSDVTIRVHYRYEDGVVKPVWKAWRRGGEPLLIDFTSGEVIGKIKEFNEWFRGLIKEKMLKSEIASHST